MSERLVALTNEVAELRRRLQRVEQTLQELQQEGSGDPEPAAPQPEPSETLSATAGPETEAPSLVLGSSDQTQAPSAADADGGLSLGDAPASGQSTASDEATSSDGGLSLGGAAPEAAEPAVEVEASAEQSPQVALLRRLAELPAAAKRSGVSIAPKDLSFAQKASVLATQKPDAVTGAAGDQLILRCVQKEFGNLAGYYLPPYDAFQKVLADVEQAFLRYVEDSMGLRFFPYPNETSADAAQRLASADGNITERTVPSLKPAGTPLAVLQRGVVAPNGGVQKAVIAVSGGADSDSARRLLKIGEEIARAPRGGEVMADLQKAVNDLSKGLPENVVLRELLNTLWAANTDKNLAGPVQKLIQILESEHGWHMLRVRVGDTFGDKHKPDNYERRKVRSSEAPGTIVAVARPGFIDGQGVAVQKAVLNVSE
jgi:hypothetical protein